jgi:Flp pilus assembly protein TadD
MAFLTGCGSETAQRGSEYQTVAAIPGGDTQAAVDQNRRGLELLAAGDTDGAEAAFKAALEADVFFGPAHNNLGSIYYSRGELYLAAWEFQYAARLAPDDPRPHNNLAEVYQAAGKDDKALAAFTRAHELQPDSQQIAASLVRVRLKLGKTDGQTAELLEALVNESDDDTLRNWAAGQLMRIKDARADQ